MKFHENARPIFQQIADRVCDDVTSGVFGPDSRIPSVREYAARLQVNVNTVMRSFDYLADHGVVYNKRGIGYFIAPDATERIARMRLETFYSDDMQYFFSRLKSMGVAPEELTRLYTEYFNQENTNQQ